jgi:hypothetical protein
MRPDLWPTDPRAAAALVALVLADICDAKDEQRELLLRRFIRAAWPSERGLRQ